MKRPPLHQFLLAVLPAGALALGTVAARAEPPGVEWVKTFAESLHAVQQTGDGGYIAVGRAFIRTDPQGRVVWENPEIEGFSLDQTADGGYVVGGGAAEYDGLVTKTDSEGNPLWSRGFQGYDCDGWPNCVPVSEAVEHVLQTSDGGYIAVTRGWYGAVKLDSQGELVCGVSEPDSPRCFDGRCDVRSIRQTGDGGYVSASGSWSFHVASGRLCLSRHDAERQLLWERHFEGRSYSSASVLQPSGGGYVIFAGDSVVKTDADGNIVWENPDVHAMDGIQAADGGYVSIVRTDRLGETALAKVDAAGNRVAEAVFPGWFLADIQPTADGGYVAAGSHRNAPDGREGLLVKLSATLFGPPPSFRRGDPTEDDLTNFADAVRLLEVLFLAGELASDCPGALDVNDDDVVDIGDPLGLVFYLVGLGAPPALPFAECGPDPTPGLPCESFGPCADE